MLAEQDNVFVQKQKLRDQILEYSKMDTKERKGDWAQKLTDFAKGYRKASVNTTLHDFNVNAAKLTEHARLHRLFMRVVGRLVDYAELWERDMIYLWLGMLFQRSREFNSELELVSIDGVSLGVRVSDALIDSTARHCLDNRTVPLWHERSGFQKIEYKKVSPVLGDEFAALHKQHSLGRDFENELDAKAKEVAPKSHASLHGLGKHQIRNDLAHYNVLKAQKVKVPGGKSGGRDNGWTRTLNLTYRINAVRSLMSYDIKLKNAVSGSIKRILRDEGMEIDWKMSRDRLRSARLSPLVLEHLTMLPKECESCRFGIPRVSKRQLSMTAAIFGFGNSGYSQKFSFNGKDVKQPPSYPEWAFAGVQIDVPGALLE